jgi:hypothetical protein
MALEVITGKHYTTAGGYVAHVTTKNMSPNLDRTVIAHGTVEAFGATLFMSWDSWGNALLGGRNVDLIEERPEPL